MKYRLTVNTKDFGILIDQDEATEEEFETMRGMLLNLKDLDTFTLHIGEKLVSLPKGVIQSSVFELETL